MSVKIDVLGHKYDDAEPAFTAVASGLFYYHLRTKKLYDRESFNAGLEQDGKAFADGELGIPSDDYIARHEDMLKNLYSPELPAAPTLLNVTADGAGVLDLAWTDASANEAGFRIERSDAVDGTFVEVGAVAAGTVTWTDEGLFAGTQYFYRVYAFNVTGDSASFAAASGTTEA